MARTRDIVIGVIIVGTFLAATLFVVFMFWGMSDGLSGSGGFGSFGDRIGVIELYGVIEEQNGRRIIEDLDKYAENSRIKAIILHINSGGGGSAISEEIYDAVVRASAEKPVVASVASVAASGGYMVACGADRIIANSSSLTGSIGVIMQYYTYPGLLEKIGVETETIKSGQLKDVGTPSRRMTKEEELMLRSVVMDSYEQFVQIVANGRDMTSDEVYPFADGSIFTGLQAYNLGLIDTLGGFKEAVELAAELAGIEGEPDIVRPYHRERKGFFDLIGYFFGDLGSKIEQVRTGPRLLYQYQ